MKKIKTLNIWVRYAILIVSTVILGFLINLFLYAPISTLADENAWLGFFGSVIGAGIAGIVTIWGIEYAIKNTILNVKPVIRPIKTDFFLYYKKDSMFFASNKSMRVLMKEYEESQKVYFSETDKLDCGSIINLLAEEYKDTKWEAVFRKLNIEDLFNKVKEICQSQTYKNGINNLVNELPEIYKSGVGSRIVEKICENFQRNIAFKVINTAKDELRLYYWVYNVGAGNAIDIRISWDFSKNYHKKLCNDLGFSEEEYSDMMKKFSLDKIDIAEADVMLNTNDGNKIRVFIPDEVILFIKHLYIKSFKNCNEMKHMNNNALVGENQIAELNISCIDIYEENHIEHYDVMLRIESTLQNYYNYEEEYFYLKFNKKK